MNGMKSCNAERQHVMSATATSAYEWRDLPWRKLERQVYRLQTRIFRASRRGDTKTVHRLQRLLMNSWAARCLAVRKVTQDNRGKKTAGIDGVKRLSEPQRLALAAALVVTAHARPVRRVWIPKPGKAERRPLGIPTIRDRAAQTLVRLALDPEWEARWEPNSFGFRPGRSVHDAIAMVFNAVAKKPKYVLDADIAACFDRIDHAALLRKLQTFPTLRRVIRGWLKAGVWDGVDFKPTEAGTPQGGALSPLLANIALHGLETHLRAAFPRDLRLNGEVRWGWKPTVVRYADDFVVLHEDREVIEQTRHLAAAWLADLGLELKPEKTRICHTLESKEELQVGFDFLGFRNWRGVRLGFKTLIKPSKSAQQRHVEKTSEVVHRHRTSTQEQLIAALNPVVIGWANFYSGVVSSRVYSRLDHALHAQLRRWARRRHPNKTWPWITARYWAPLGRRRWVFRPPRGQRLIQHEETPIVRHEMVRLDKSLYDGDLVYWATRMGRHPELPRSKAYLLKRQRGRCTVCGLLFAAMQELVENDHRIPRSLRGSDAAHNRQLVHGHCHDQKTRTDGSNRSPHRRGIHAKDRSPRSRVNGNVHARF
jgi:RNA-directed DNA polymerase